MRNSLAIMRAVVRVMLSRVVPALRSDPQHNYWEFRRHLIITHLGLRTVPIID